MAILLDGVEPTSGKSSDKDKGLLRLALGQQSANRGGILVDREGRLVGIKLCSSGRKQEDMSVGLAAPVSLAQKLLAMREPAKR